jgi:hypothetical protein
MTALNGTPRLGLVGATLGFFVGFAAVALFGPMAQRLQAGMGLSPVLLRHALRRFCLYHGRYRSSDALRSRWWA